MKLVSDLFSRFKDNIHIGQALPPKVAFALRSLELLLYQQVMIKVKELAEELPRVEGFQEAYTTTITESSTSAKDKARLNSALLEDLSHLSAMQELLAAVKQHRPALKQISYEEAKEKGGDCAAWRAMKDKDAAK